MHEATVRKRFTCCGQVLADDRWIWLNHVIYSGGLYIYALWVGVTTVYMTHDTRIKPQPPRITTFQYRRIKLSNQSKMADIDKWIDIAKECKYLPENDLKVTSSSYLSYRYAKDKQCMREYIYNLCIFIGRLIYYVSLTN